MRLGIIGLILAMGVAAPAAADTIVINNGLAPPNPENVIDAGNSFPGDYVSVHNVGCPTVADHCPMPWGDPTSVELVESGRSSEHSSGLGHAGGSSECV